MTPQPCHYCNMLVSRDREGRAVATNPAVAEPWACPASPSGHLVAANWTGVPTPDTRIAEIRALLAAFDWERDDRQLALEAIDRIVSDDGED